MRTLNLTDTHNLIILEQGDHGGFASDDEGNVYLEINGRTHSDWKGYLASEISEDEAMEITKILAPKLWHFSKNYIVFTKIAIRETLKSAGLLLKKGERPEFPFYLNLYRLELKLWKNAIPLSSIIIVER